jgi:lipopolysaccharide/colanic/teichoic acid biosynthesis glycosyltransferase
MYRVSKRLFDFTVAVSLLLLLLPIGLSLALLLKIFQDKVLFSQRRPGLHGRPFTLYKFCSMNDARDLNGDLLPDEARLTRVGAFIRSYSLDELPQLWNVVRGDMSLVGPRPLLMEYLSRYSFEQARRHEVRPGITGWAQVNGRNAIGWAEKLSLDVWYVDNSSFSLDLKILWITVRRVISRSGISSEGHATMPEFSGRSK